MTFKTITEILKMVRQYLDQEDIGVGINKSFISYIGTEIKNQ